MPIDEKTPNFPGDQILKIKRHNVKEHAYGKTFRRNTRKNEEELNELLEVLKKNITIVPLEELLPCYDEAEKISPDLDDVAYIALALKLKCAI